MIEGLKGAVVLKELAALAQNLEKKLSLPVTIEVVQKLLDTKDGYKYLANVDGKLVEAMSKKELEAGIKYWADAVKNQTTNTLALENLAKKPQILQNEVFKSETLSKALGFEKLVEVVKSEVVSIVRQDAKTADTQKPLEQKAATPEQKPTPPQTQSVPARLAAADTELAKTRPEDIKAPQKEAAMQPSAPKEAKGEIRQTPQTAPITAQSAQKQEAAPQIIASLKENVLKELKAVIQEAVKAQAQAWQPEKSEKPTQPQQPQKTEIPKSEAPQTPRAQTKEDIKERLKDFKSLVDSPSAPTKQEMEKAKISKEEMRAAKMELASESIKNDVAAKIEQALLQNFETLPKNAIEEAAQKLADVIFGKAPGSDADERMLKILEHLEKQLEQKAAKEGGKKNIAGAELRAEENDTKTKEAQAEGSGAEKTESKTENPASKLKAQLLEELAKVSTKSDFSILSNVAMALNKEVFTFVLKDKGVLQFKKKRQKELNAKTVEFYSAFETLGPVSGEISHIGGETALSLNVEFESTYRFLKENLKELSFFDKKNVSIMHGIKELAEIKSSFLDTTG